MKNKFSLVSALLSLGLILGACGSNDTTTNNDEPDTEEKTQDSNNSGNDSKKEENAAISDDTVETDDYKIVIKEIEQLKGNYDTSILAIEIEYTNKTGESQNPWFDVAGAIKATQETDSTIELLDGANGLYPEDYKTELVKMGDSDVKGNDTTVNAVVGFEIKFPGKPVSLIDFNGSDTPETFERIVETTE